MNLSVARAAKTAGKNFIPYVIVCAIFAVGIVAYDTNMFTKPPTWWGSLHSWPAGPASLLPPPPGATKGPSQ